MTLPEDSRKGLKRVVTHTQQKGKEQASRLRLEDSSSLRHP